MGKAVDPTHTLFLFERAVGIFLLSEAARLAHPAVPLEQTEGDALGRDGQGRVQVHPAAGLVVQGTQAGDVLLGAVVELGGVLNAQYAGMLAQALDGAGNRHGASTRSAVTSEWSNRR
jgi:hypothetical protein